VLLPYVAERFRDAQCHEKWVCLSLRETCALSCVSGARQRLENARQWLCRAFFVEAHGKGHTVVFCTVNSLCRAPSSITHGEQTLPCVTCGARQTKVIDGTTGYGRRTGGDDVQKTLPCGRNGTHGKEWHLCSAPHSFTESASWPLIILVIVTSTICGI
jgi:hypothetical protein